MDNEQIEQVIRNGLQGRAVPVDDVLDWLVCLFGAVPKDVLQAYGFVLSGRFGAAESVGAIERFYACGDKGLSAVPLRLVPAQVVTT
jgi:hypothetical protein